MLLRCRGPAGAGAPLHRARRHPRSSTSTAASSDGGDRLGYTPPERGADPPRDACAATPRPARSCTPTHPQSSSPGWPSSRSCPCSAATTSPPLGWPPMASPSTPARSSSGAPTLAVEMLDAMGDRPVCLLRGHGLVAIGGRGRRGRAAGPRRRPPVPHRPGGSRPRAEPWPPIADDDLAELPDLGDALNQRHAVAVPPRRAGGRRLGPEPDRPHRGRGRAGQRRRRMIDIEALTAPIADGLVPAHIYHDDEVHRLEVERLFARAWVFVAHESEIAATERLRRAQRGRRLVPRDPRPRRRDPRDVQHVRAPRHAGVPRRARHRVDVPLPVPRVDLPQRRHAGRACRSTTRPTAATRASSRRARRCCPRPSLRDPQRHDLRQPRPGRAAVRGVARRLRASTSTSTRPRARPAWSCGARSAGGSRPTGRSAPRTSAGDSYHTPHTHASVVEIGLFGEPKPHKRKEGVLYQRRTGRRHDVQAAAGRRLRVRDDATSATTPTSSPRRGPSWPDDGLQALIGAQRLHALGGDAVPEPQLRAQLARGGRRPGGAVHLDPPVAAGRARRDRGAVVVRGRGGRARRRSRPTPTAPT